ncbi:tRNA lysidine(34) synthetase TilS [Bacillus solitudinis]|uniref:tRNA lysidine(34) synthetase TilS n=1 Tax=Bacillus solitudinis TaxID=2014074 RepID=UPI000C23A7D7|nr:tRNA lysidine(34) synthetase TilS [Bacillus solitudinis]
MKQAVHKFIKKHRLFNGGETVIVAISGGPDSMALLHYLWEARKMYQIDVYAAHAHHQLRETEADEDEEYIEAFCRNLAIPLFRTKLDVRGYAKSERMNIQAAGRLLRYRWFDSLLSETPKRYIATGHHGDDQVETVMMKLIRGSIPFHLSGISVKRKIGTSVIIRPFLGITKQEIEHYCKEEQINPRQDSSNQSHHYTRNRFRFHMLPFMKKENKQVHHHIQRYSEWLEEDQQFLMELAEKTLSSISLEKSEQLITISREAFMKVSVPLQRRLIHLILKYITGKNSPIITSIHIEQLLELIHTDAPSNEVHLTGDLFVWRDYQLCHFTNEKRMKLSEEERRLSVPGEIETALGVIKAYYADEETFEENEQLLILDAHEIVLPLLTRQKREGDRIAIQGIMGTKKLSRLFIDKKVSKHLRDVWPIVVSGNGEILWVPMLQKVRTFDDDLQIRKKLILSFIPNSNVKK